MSLIGNSHPMVTRGCRVPRAPPLHTLRGSLPAFLNLHGAKKYEKLCFENIFLEKNPVSLNLDPCHQGRRPLPQTLLVK